MKSRAIVRSSRRVVDMKSRKWWYSIVKTVAGRSLRGQIPNNSDIGKVINRAVRTAYRATESLTDGKERIYAINATIKAQNKSVGGVAMDCHICERVIVKWTSEFVYMVAAEMGIYQPPQNGD